MEAIRHFYEELIGFPLMATWAEQTDLFGKVRTYMHCFFEIGNGECLAFFQFADADDAEEFGPELPPSGFRHLAMKVDQETQDGIRDRLAAGGVTEPQSYILNHGYCYSLYCSDPSGLLLLRLWLFPGDTRLALCLPRLFPGERYRRKRDCRSSRVSTR